MPRLKLLTTFKNKYKTITNISSVKGAAYPYFDNFCNHRVLDSFCRNTQHLHTKIKTARNTALQSGLFACKQHSLPWKHCIIVEKTLSGAKKEKKTITLVCLMLKEYLQNKFIFFTILHFFDKIKVGCPFKIRNKR